MKMPEKHDLLAAILAAKEQGHRGNPCVLPMQFSRQEICRRRAEEIDATMCAIIAWSIRDLRLRRTGNLAI